MIIYGDLVGTTPLLLNAARNGPQHDIPTIVSSNLSNQKLYLIPLKSQDSKVDVFSVGRHLLQLPLRLRPSLISLKKTTLKRRALGLFLLPKFFFFFSVPPVVAKFNDILGVFGVSRLGSLAARR